MPLRPRKSRYYLRSLAALFALAEPGSLIRFLSGRRDAALVLRDGTTLRLGGLLDLLILKETMVDDSYRLRELDGTSPAAIVDVGSSVGDFALWAARRFPSATVIAFEPNPAVFRLLEENVRANAATNVVAHRLAVGVTVPAVRLDAIVDQEHIDLLKIDCEGLELEVLEGARGLLPRVRRVALEYHRRLVPETDRLCIEMLKGHGFTTSSVADPYDNTIGYVHGHSADA